MAPSGLPCPASQQVSPVDEGLWLELMAPVAARWKARAEEAGLKPSVVAYARARARKTSTPYAKRLDGCARAGVPVKCACRTDVRWYTCRAHLLCRTCRKQRARKLRAKIAAALEAAMLGAPAGYHLVMVTITLRHDPDVGAARRRLMDAWRRYRKANFRRWGEFFFVGTHEVTPGADGLGHPHAHVVCLWPMGSPGDGTQGDWRLQRELWLAACPDAARVDFTASKQPHRAAKYVSKYVSKGVQTSDFTPQLRARVLAGTYGARWVFSSRGAWVKFQPCCKSCGVPVTRVMVGWRDRCSWSPPDATPDWFYDRGPPQYTLALPEPY